MGEKEKVGYGVWRELCKKLEDYCIGSIKG